jgi:hypothetical protein
LMARETFKAVSLPMTRAKFLPPNLPPTVVCIMTNGGEQRKIKPLSIKGFYNIFQMVADDGDGWFGGAEGI